MPSTIGPGGRVGSYEVLSAIGAGGMGEVYRARDTKLGRDVALKVLPSSFAADPERIARFRREAQVLASLNHPHIGAIHGVEESNGAQVLVLEFVDGATLADRIRRGPLPIDEATAIARQIADALGAAHEKGIIHRDLKPANIALTSQDDVKILDFGLARALDGKDGSDPSNSPTLTFQATQAGVILGTAAYMSPEQAKGRAADKRADVWAFGCVLYEMLSGRRAFEGDDVSDTLAAVLRGDPDWSALPPATPPAIRTLIQQCLVKDRQARAADIAVATYVLRGSASPGNDVASAPAKPARASRAAQWLAIAMAPAILMGIAAGWIAHRPPTVASSMTRFTVTVPPDQMIVEVVRRRRLLALSPDGSRLAYIANDQIYLRPMDALEATPIRGSREQPVEVVFSPDGEWIAYFSGPRLKKLPIAGGVPITLAEVPGLSGMSWEGDRLLVAVGTRGIVEVPAAGGAPKLLVDNAAKGGALQFPQLLPGGRHILYTILNGAISGGLPLDGATDIIVETIATGERKTLVRGGFDARYLPTGHLLFMRDGVLFAQAMDISRLEVTGAANVVVDGVATSVGTLNAHYAISNNGTMAYMPRAASAMTTLVWRSRQGVETPINAPAHAYDQPRVSPDGRRIVVHAIDQDNDLWVWDIASETLARLTFERGVDSFPAWLRDSRRIVYVSSGGEPNLYVRAADGTGQREVLLDKSPQTTGALVTNGTTPDGASLVFSVGVPSDIMMLPLDGPRVVKPLLANPYAERSAQVSPDGRWLAYQSDESGVFQVYVRTFPNVDQGRWQVSTDGGTVPIWLPNGRELFFIDRSEHVVSVPVVAGPGGFAFGKPSVAFDFSDRPISSPYRNYDLAPDGSRFVLVKDASRGQASLNFIVRLNWFEELRTRVPKS